MDDRCVLMSIRPRFANLILSGEKDIELRRQRACFPHGMPILLYASHPVKSVIGWAVVKSVHWLPKAQMWESYGGRTGVEEPEFHYYFNSANNACGIELLNPRKLSNPVGLRTIQASCDGFRPPQSYRFVEPGEPVALALGLDLRRSNSL